MNIPDQLLIAQEQCKLFSFRGACAAWNPRVIVRPGWIENVVEATIDVPLHEKGLGPLTLHKGLPLHLNKEEEIGEFITNTVIELLQHEVYESVLFRGEPVVEPHPENK